MYCHWGEITELQFNSGWKVPLDINCVDINLPRLKHGQLRVGCSVFWITSRTEIPQLFWATRTSIWPTLWYKNLLISNWTRTHCWPMFNLSMRPAGPFLWSCSLASWSPVRTVAWAYPRGQDVAFAFAELPEVAVSPPLQSVWIAALSITANTAIYKKGQIKKIHWLNVWNLFMNKPKKVYWYVFVWGVKMWLFFFLTLPLHWGTSECAGIPYCTNEASFQSLSRYLGWEEEHDSLNEILMTVAYLTLPMVCKYIIVKAQIRSCFQHLTTFKVKSMIQKLNRCYDSSNCWCTWQHVCMCKH